VRSPVVPVLTGCDAASLGRRVPCGFPLEAERR
jgi:hypothetical protein